MTIDFFGVGGSSVDLILRVPRLPARDEKIVAQRVGKLGGGLVANATCAAARLGLRAAWSGTVGDDEAGRLVLDELAQFGVDAALAQVGRDTATDSCIILLDDSGERAILVVPTTSGKPELTPALRATLTEARLVYLIPQKLDWFRELAQVVRAAGGIIMLDIEPSAPVQGDELRDVIKLSDLVSCNRGGLKLVVGHAEPDAGARELLALGPRVVTLTLGADGACAFSAQEEFSVTGHRMSVVDTTGAGDCFNAAFAFAYLKGWNLARALAFANAAAALSTQAIGARGHLPDPGAVEQFLAQVDARRINR